MHIIWTIIVGFLVGVVASSSIRAGRAWVHPDHGPCIGARSSQPFSTGAWSVSGRVGSRIYRRGNRRHHSVGHLWCNQEKSSVGHPG